MRYAYEDMSPEQFELLVVAISRVLFGVGTQPFAKGPDGGRDAKFRGTANQYPSTSEPWKGTVIIQAKHTSGINRRFTDSDFYSETSKSCVLAEEIPRIKSLYKKQHLDYYFLCSNRRLTGNALESISSYLSSMTSVPKENIALFGIDDIELVLRGAPEIASQLKIDPVDSPLNVSPFDLAEIIEAFSKSISHTLPKAVSSPTERTSYERKNTLNGFDRDSAREWRRRFLMYTTTIKEFLELPSNAQLADLYDSTTIDFKLKILSRRSEHQDFSKILEYIYDLLIARDPILARFKKYTRAMLFYMYWNCDIGQVDGDDSSTD